MSRARSHSSTAISRHDLGSRRGVRPRVRGGAILIEATLVLLVLVMLTFGGIEFGYFIYVKQTLSSAARAGAREAILADATSTSVSTKVQALMTTLTSNGNALTASDYTLNVYDDTSGGGSTTTPDAIPADHDVKVEVIVPWSTVGFTGLVMNAEANVKASIVMRKEG
jgi:Flp pilus assembly protein TadG